MSRLYIFEINTANYKGNERSGFIDMCVEKSKTRFPLSISFGAEERTEAIKLFVSLISEASGATIVGTPEAKTVDGIKYYFADFDKFELQFEVV